MKQILGDESKTTSKIELPVVIDERVVLKQKWYFIKIVFKIKMSSKIETQSSLSLFYITHFYYLLYSLSHIN